MNKSKVKWTPQAEQDIDQLREYIACHFSVDLAIEIVDKLITKVEELIGNNPLCGQIVESNPLFSKIIYEKNNIYYCENPKDKIIYIVHLNARKTELDKSELSLKIK